MSRSPQLRGQSQISVVVLVLENHQGDILLTRRKKHQHLAGYWEFPGGKVEPGESLVSALIRECWEELNYRPAQPTKILETTFQYPDRLVQLHVFQDHNPKARVSPAEQQTMQWVAKSQLTTYKLPPANQVIIDHLLAKTP